jgi:phospholipid/cholesterol/gamma-HCH transport system ATP-binding protein
MIRMKNVYKSFNGNKVLRDLNLEIPDGEIFVLVGKSGSGKSVVLKHLMGLLKPDEGEVIIDQDDMAKLSGYPLLEKLMDVGMIFQGGALFDSMTVAQNVGFYLREHQIRGGQKIAKSDIRKYVEESLEKVGLKGTEELYPASLSGGMRKRASIARSVSYKPKYLFYDEPTTGLDPVTSQTIAQLIVSQQDELKGTTLVVSHDIPTALAIADRIGLIEEGKIEFVARPHEFMKYNHPIIKVFNEIIGGDLSLIGKERHGKST